MIERDSNVPDSLTTPAHLPALRPRHTKPSGKRLWGLEGGTWKRKPTAFSQSRTKMVNAIVVVAGFQIHLRTEESALDEIVMAARSSADRALGVASANLDHVYHFGRRGLASKLAMVETPEMAWLTLLDGIPLVAVARHRTGVKWPRLAGSDLLTPILMRAEAGGVRVAFFGGREEMHQELRTVLDRDFPRLTVTGFWSPSPAELDDVHRSHELAREVEATQAQILVVCLGKPRQEVWIQAHGPMTGAKVLLAFGASADFLAGRIQRAPELLRDYGLEWAYRLAREPRRLAHRYLVDGPVALARMVR